MLPQFGTAQGGSVFAHEAESNPDRHRHGRHGRVDAPLRDRRPHTLGLRPFPNGQPGAVSSPFRPEAARSHVRWFEELRRLVPTN